MAILVPGLPYEIQIVRTELLTASVRREVRADVVHTAAWNSPCAVFTTVL